MDSKIYKLLKNKIQIEGVNDINLLSGFVWEYQGATQEMELAEFIAGLLDKRFSTQIEIYKIINKVNNDRRNKKNITDSL